MTDTFRLVFDPAVFASCSVDLFEIKGKCRSAAAIECQMPVTHVDVMQTALRARTVSIITGSYVLYLLMCRYVLKIKICSLMENFNEHLNAL